MQIRPLIDSDIPAAAALLARLTDEFIVDASAPEAAEAFKRQHGAEGIRGFVAAGLVYFVAEIDGRLAGFIGLRENKHVFHMFVDTAHHRKGIARALWAAARDTALADGNPGLFTVNASNYALPVYESMGFVRTGTMQCKDGVYYNPMQLDGRDRD